MLEAGAGGVGPRTQEAQAVGVGHTAPKLQVKAGFVTIQGHNGDALGKHGGSLHAAGGIGVTF